jgi:YHS domain-containing protein
MGLRLLIGIIVLYLLYRLVAGKRPRRGASGQDLARGEDLVQDPVCQTYIPIGEAQRLSAGGKTVYFCSTACREKYQRQADREGQGDPRP